jgi:hypothetical protein
MRIAFVLVLVLPLVASGRSSTRACAEHDEREIHGFKVEVDRSLLAPALGTEDTLGRDALELLSAKLFDIARSVPPKILEKLRAVPIRLDRDDPATICACYHPSKEWLSEHGFDPMLEKHVHIANARKFLDWSKEQPSMVLHELSHAYHHQVLGYDEPRIRAAYQRAKESKRYDSVLRWSGQDARHYALENDQEFFAEMTESFLGVNDFYPFVRAELQRFDPETAKLMGEIWK